jgi:CysZ protein
MISDFLSGSNYLLRGFKLVAKPELRRFVIIPLIINTIVFATAIWFGIYQFDTLLDWLLPQGTGWWAEFARMVLWIFFAMIVLLILVFTFTIFANIIGAPFNGLLSEKVEAYLTGGTLQNSGGILDFISSILPSIISECKKLVYFLSLGIMIFILLLIPVINAVSPFLWAVFTSWMLALEYAAYPMENHGIYFSLARKELKKKRMVTFGFGITIMILNAIPIINFLVMPAAVAGATTLWVEQLKNNYKLNLL